MLGSDIKDSLIIVDDGSNNSSSESATSLKPPDDMEAYRDMSFGMAWAMLAMCLLGVVSNLFSIFVFSHRSMKRAPINVLLIGLSAIDLSLSLLSIPAFIVPGFFTYYQTWTLELIMSYSSVFIYPLTAMTHTASVWTFVIIAVERWHAVTQGGLDTVGSYGRQRSLLRRKQRRSCIFALVMVCILSFLYNFVRFFEFELVTDPTAPATAHYAASNHTDSESASNFTSPAALYTGSPELAQAPYTVPSVVPLLRNGTAHPFYMQVYYVGLYLVTHFVAPFVALLIVNGLTLHVVYTAKQRRKRLLTKRERREHKTTRMMITVVVMFIVCYTLVISLNIIEAIDNDWFQTDENRLVAYCLNDISNLLVIINAASTALIYYLFNRQYRELCLALISRILAYLGSWFCFCSWCWCNRVFQQYVHEQQRFWDRRRSTMTNSTPLTHRMRVEMSTVSGTERQDFLPSGRPLSSFTDTGTLEVPISITDITD